MTLFYLLYLALLVAWVLLVWPALRTKGSVRIWLIAVILAGIAALGHASSSLALQRCFMKSGYFFSPAKQSESTYC